MAYDLDGNEAVPASSPFIPVVQIAVDVAELLLRRWWMLVLGLALGLGYGYWRASREPDQFVAAARFLVDESAMPAGQASGSVDPADLLAERRMALARRVESIRSIPVADTVHRILEGKLDVKTSGAVEFSGEASAGDPGREELGDLIEIGLEDRLKNPDYLSQLLSIRSEVSVSFDPDTAMITISESGTDPSKLAAMPNAYVQAYRAHCLAQKTAYDRRALRTTQVALQQARQLLTRAEAAESGFRRKHQLEPRSRPDAPAGQLSEEVLRRLAQSSAGENRPPAPADKSIQMRQTVIGEALRALDQLMDVQEQFAPDSPTITQKQLEILSLMESLSDVDGPSLKGAVLTRQSYAQELAVEQSRSGPEAALEHTAFVLQHTVAIADALYSAVLSQQRDLQVRNALAVPEVHLVEPATIPHTPIGPDRSKIVQKAGIAGFGLVFVLVLLFQYGDARVKGVNQVVKVSGAQVIAALSFDEELDARPSEESIVVQEGSFSPLAEGLRELRTRLMFATEPPTGKALLVTSAFSGDGKTFVASNLAVSLAQVGERVLLIDGDLRKPRLHHVFGVPNLRGFSDLSDPATLHELVRPCMLPNLHLLSAGPAIAAPAEFIARSRTQEILRILAAKYDRVIYDTPPINLVADASTLAVLAESVVLVIRDGGCTESELAAAAERVRRTNVRFAGVVLNHLRTPVIAYGAGYGYGRQYYPSQREPARPS